MMAKALGPRLGPITRALSARVPKYFPHLAAGSPVQFALAQWQLRGRHSQLGKLHHADHHGSSETPNGATTSQWAQAVCAFGGLAVLVSAGSSRAQVVSCEVAAVERNNLEMDKPRVKHQTAPMYLRFAAHLLDIIIGRAINAFFTIVCAHNCARTHRVYGCKTRTHSNPRHNHRP